MNTAKILVTFFKLPILLLSSTIITSISVLGGEPGENAISLVLIIAATAIYLLSAYIPHIETRGFIRTGNVVLKANRAKAFGYSMVRTLLLLALVAVFVRVPTV